MHGRVDSPEQILVGLRMSRWSPRAFAAFAPALVEALAGAPAEQRPAWSDALERVLVRHAPSPEDGGLCFSLGVAAMHVGDWGLAEKALRNDLLVDPRCAASWINLGRCVWELGRCAEAEAAFAHALALEPEAEATARALQTAQRWRLRCEALPWWTPARASDGEVLLEPMGEKHAMGFFEQCRGTSVVERTPLTPFGSLDQVAAYLDHHAAREDLVTLAVVERRFGFVGEVTLALAAEGRSAELSGWIGEAFQGRRYGTRATRLCLALAEPMGIREVSAEGARENLPSLRALLAAGGTRVESTDASRWRLSLRAGARGCAPAEQERGGESV
jgi:RimJ/RimL family protein N-acetyltransferase